MKYFSKKLRQIIRYCKFISEQKRNYKVQKEILSYYISIVKSFKTSEYKFKTYLMLKFTIVENKIKFIFLSSP